MTQSALSMSGLHRLDSEHTEFLTTMGLTVPSMMTSEQLSDLLARAEALWADIKNPMVSEVSREYLDEIKAGVPAL